MSSCLPSNIHSKHTQTVTNSSLSLFLFSLKKGGHQPNIFIPPLTSPMSSPKPTIHPLHHPIRLPRLSPQAQSIRTRPSTPTAQIPLSPVPPPAISRSAGARLNSSSQTVKKSVKVERRKATHRSLCSWLGKIQGGRHSTQHARETESISIYFRVGLARCVSGKCGGFGGAEPMGWGEGRGG